MNAEAAYEILRRDLAAQTHSFNEARRLFDRGGLTRRIRRVVVEASFLGAYSSFEAFIEELLYSVLLGNSGLPDAVELVQFRDRQTAERVLTMNVQFLRLLPWKEGIARTSDRLMDGRGPFGRMDRSVTEVKLLEEARRLRNAVAHRSESAKANAGDLLRDMPPRRRTVADFLSVTSSGRSVFELHMDNFRAVGACLTAPTVAAGHGLLLDERPYTDREVVPRGTYKCEIGSHKRVVRRVSEELGTCSECGRGRSLWLRVW